MGSRFNPRHTSFPVVPANSMLNVEYQVIWFICISDIKYDINMNGLNQKKTQCTKDKCMKSVLFEPFVIADSKNKKKQKQKKRKKKLRFNKNNNINILKSQIFEICHVSRGFCCMVLHLFGRYICQTFHCSIENLKEINILLLH